MAMQWFYKASGTEVGPISGNELRNLADCGTVTRDTQVRNAPDGNWVAAERVKGLFTSTTDPPVPPLTPSPKETNMTVEERLARLEKAIENGTKLDGTTREGVTARGFCLVDGEGNRRALLGNTENGAGLQLYDDKGKARAELIVLGEGLALTLSDEEGKVRVSLGVAEGGPILSLQDKTDNASAVLLCGDKGPALRLCDEMGIARVHVLLHTGLGQAALWLHDEKGNMRVTLTDSKAGPCLVLFDEKGQSRAAFGFTVEGSNLTLQDEHGNTRAILIGPADGAALLAMLDEKGNMNWHAP